MSNLHNARQRASVAVTALVVGFFGLVAAASAAADPDAITAVGSATTTLKDTIVSAMPLILGVAVVIVVLTLAKRLVKKAG